ncbi:hypothetical protein [Methanochimaera problematica]|nr:hypothetical protein [Methanoplanus sp. FWC-SCC4]
MFFSIMLIPAAVMGFSGYVGDTIEISGAAPGADYVYLFLYGPNLASNGVNPEDISSEVVSGDGSSFAKVSVRNNVWTYKWDTKTGSGTPDAGTYFIYAVDRPAGKKDLSGAEYAVKTVELKRPSVQVDPKITEKQTEIEILPSLEEDETKDLSEKPLENNYSVTGTNASSTKDSPLGLFMPLIAVLISCLIICKVVINRK